MRKIPQVVMLVCLAIGASGPALAGAGTGLGIVLDNCQNQHVDPDTRIGACGQLIHSNMASHRILAAFYAFRGIAYRDKGDDPDAIKDFTKAIDLKPDYADAFAFLGALLEKQGKQDEAATDFERAGFFYLGGNKCDEAIGQYSSAVEINPKFAAALYGRGLYEKKNGDAKAGQADMDAAAAADPAIAQKYQWPG
jgi:tetratricopeptide (TPR) repeat protein